MVERDYTHLSEAEKQKLESLAQAIRNKYHGIDVRESIALAIEWVNREYKLTIQNNKLTQREFENAKSKVSSLESDMDEFIKRYSEQIAGNTSLDETIDARVDVEGVSHTTLKDRLDKEHTEVTTELEHLEYDSLVNRKGPKPMITWIDDDGNIGFYEKFYPLALEYGIPMTSGAITMRIGTEPKYISYEQYHEMARNGIEIVSHTHTHNIDHSLTDMTEEEMRVELSTAKNILKENGWNHDVLVYPFGRENATVHNIVRQYHKAAIDVFYAPTQESENGSLARVGFNQFRIERVNADSRHEVVKQMMDKAVEDNAWIILMTHADQSDVWRDIPTAQANARSLIEYAKNAGLEFVTVDEGLKHHGNLAQFGNLTIDANGEVPPATVEWTEYSGFGYVDPSHIENYKFGNTRQKVRNADISLFNLPSTNAGTVYTFRDKESTYSYQRFVSLERNSNEMLRFWSDGWSDWQTVGLMRRERTNEFGNNDPITSYPKGEMTIQKVTSANSVHFNLHNDLRVGSSSGIIYTYRDVSEDSYSHQLYVGGSKNILIKRNWDVENNAWGVWDYPGLTSKSHVNLIPAGSPVTSYPQGQFTITKLNTANTPTIGLGGYGILKTYRDSEPSYSHQEFMNNRDNTKSTRTWDVETNDWGAWSQ